MAKTSISGGKVAFNSMPGGLVITIPARLSSGLLQFVREEVLNRLRTMPARAVIFDMSTSGAIDQYEFNALADIVRMVNLMGTQAIFSGLPPGVVSSLLDLDVDVSGILAVRGIDEALAQFEPAGEAEDPAPEELNPTAGI